MLKNSKFLSIFFFLLLYNQSSYGHVNHYDNINFINFEIYRNNKYIGNHTFSFQREESNISVTSQIDFKIKKLGIVLYKYHAKGTEFYKDGKLIKFTSITNQNGKKKFVNLTLNNNLYKIKGSSYNGDAPIEYLLGTWWNHNIIKAKAQISAVSGRIIKQKVDFLGKETLKIKNKNYNTLHFKFQSSDAKLDKKKKLNTDIWYDENTLLWVKASFEKSGKWEYILKELK